ncbi:uncharacterized protein B0P05DRAFT_10548 [Gilbertella persicaria]|uniref:uncharacterized protein n=1 Tax=Gilbertella persicaria TaxID=101096 RepID=UPI00221EC29D|nr:uncharacterized protein B0P05DRAFT_10548 [Gilbertella persicaria]KAI8098420.1 hypothetical protein B0P05DRAFT_10548 [Gilbertella persicaria]
MVIHRHYRICGNSLHKSLLSSGIIFSVGVIGSNIITAILISCRVMGGLSADLYSFDWVITSYLLIKQFSQKTHGTKSTTNNDEDEDEGTSKTMHRPISFSSLDIISDPSYRHHTMLVNEASLISSELRDNSRLSAGILSASTTIKPTQEVTTHKIVL